MVLFLIGSLKDKDTLRLAACLEPLPCCGNVAILSLFSMYYLGRYSSEVVVLVPISYSPAMSIHYSNRFHIFFVCTHSRQKINTCLWVNKWGKNFSPQRAECFRPFIFHFGCFVQRSTLFHMFMFMIKPCIWCSTQEIMKNILNINVDTLRTSTVLSFE